MSKKASSTLHIIDDMLHVQWRIYLVIRGFIHFTDFDKARQTEEQERFALGLAVSVSLWMITCLARCTQELRRVSDDDELPSGFDMDRVLEKAIRFLEFFCFGLMNISLLALFKFSAFNDYAKDRFMTVNLIVFTTFNVIWSCLRHVQLAIRRSEAANRKASEPDIKI